MSVGSINRINLDTRHIDVLTHQAFEDQMSLSADGTRAWYVAAYPRAMVRSLPGGGRFPASSSEAPCVVMWDKGLKTPVAGGWGATLSDNEKLLVIGGNGDQEQALDLATNKIADVAFPNYAYGTRSIPKDDIVIAWAQQTRVEDVDFTRMNGMPGPRSLLRIAAFETTSDRTATLYSKLDPRRQWSYGSWSSSTSAAPERK